MLVTVAKSGTKDRLQVDLIDIYLVGKNITKPKEKDILERFQCKKFDIGGSKLPTETKKCQTGPYHYQQIEKAIFKILKEENRLALDDLKTRAGLSNKAWDKSIKGLAKMGLTKVSKTEEGLFVELTED